MVSVLASSEFEDLFPFKDCFKNTSFFIKQK